MASFANALLILDLETAPLPTAGAYIDPLPSPDPPAPHRGLKDPEKVAADLAAKQAAHAAALEKWEQDKLRQIDACALNPDLAQIIAVGLDDGRREVVTADNMPEDALIRAVAGRISHATICIGFNVRFDLAMLQRRALYLGVPFPRISLDRYRHPQLIDLQDVLSFDGYLSIKGKTLDWWARRFGLDVPEDACSGEDMPRLYKAGEWAAIRHHCETDIITTRALAERVGVLCGADKAA